MTPRVCICMWYDDGIREYADYAKRINEEYCRKHGIDLIYGSRKYYKDRKSYWEKVPFVYSVMDSYDYVIWIDADAFFYKDSVNILDLIQEISKDKDFIFSMDYNPQNIYDINTGVFIVKCTPYAKVIMNEWANNQMLVDTSPYPDWPEQGVIRGMVMRNFMDLANRCVVLQYGILQHFFEYELEPVVTKGCKLNTRPLILHLAANPADQRILKTKTYWETHFAHKV